MLFDLLILGFFIYQILFGWKQGFLAMVLHFIIVVLSMLVAFLLAKAIANLYSTYFIVIIAFIFVYLVLRSLLFLLVKQASNIFNKVPLLGNINRFFGSVLGIFIATALTLITIMILNFITPFSLGAQELQMQSYILQLIK